MPVSIPILRRLFGALGLFVLCCGGCSLFEESDDLDAGVATDGATRADARAGLCTGCRRITRVVLGTNHSCAIDDGGGLACWGQNDYGQAGTGEEQILRPRQVTLGSSVTDVALGSFHTCALLSSGEVSCWGRNHSGQLGVDGIESSASPVPVSFSEGFVAITASVGHTCGLTASKRAHCWGKREAVRGSDPYVKMDNGSELDQVVSLSLGNAHACALREDASVWCWGRNRNGEFGSQTVETASAVRSGFGPSIGVSAATFHSCSVDKKDRDVWCAGWTGLGEGYFGGTPMALPTGVPMLAVTSGANSACGLDENKALWCWGSNLQGQLGLEGITESRQPVAVPAGNVMQVSAGGTHVCAVLDDGNLLCWGENAYGQLGDGSTEPRFRPTQIEVRDE